MNTQKYKKRGLTNKKRNNIYHIFLKKYGIAIIVMLSSLIGGYIYQDFLNFEKLFYFKDIGSDTINNHYARVLNKQHYGSSPYDIGDWTFYKGMGEPLTKSSYKLPNIYSLTQAGSSLFAFLHFDFDFYQVAYRQWLALILSSLLCFFYFRVMAFSPYSSVIGALLLSFCGWAIIGGSWQSHIDSTVKGIFVLLSFELLFRKRIWILLPISICFLSIPELYFYAEFLALYATFRYFSVKGWTLKGWLTLGGIAVGLAIVGVLFKAPSLFHSITKIIEMPRVSGSSSFVNKLSSISIFSLESSLHYFTALMRTFSNDLLGNGNDFKGWYNYLEAPTFYCGLSILLLIPQLFLSLNKRQKIVYLSFILFWLLIITFPFFRYAFYKFAGNYYKQAVSLFVPITLVFMGIQALSRLDKAQILNKWLLLGTLIFLLVLLYFPYSAKLQKLIDVSLQTTVAVFLVIEALCIYLLSTQKWRQLAYPLFLLIICIEVGFLHHQTFEKRIALTTAEHQAKIGFNDYTVEAVAYVKSIDKSFYRCTKDYSSGPAMHSSINDAQAQGFYSTPSYSSTNPKYYINFLQATEAIGTSDNDTRWSSGLRGQAVLQSLCGVKYAFTKGSGNNFERAGYTSIQQFKDVKVLRNNLALPLGIGYNQYILYKDYKGLNKFQKSIALLKAVVITKEQLKDIEGLKRFELNSLFKTPEEYGTQYGQDIEQLKQNVLSIQKRSDNTIAGRIVVDKPMMVFYSIPYNMGWKAFVDEKEIPITILDMGLIGVMVDSGNHEITLQFFPKFTFVGNIVFIIVFLLFLSAIWWFYQNKTPHKKIFLASLFLMPIVLLLHFPFWELFFVGIALFIWLAMFQYPNLLRRFA